MLLCQVCTDILNQSSGHIGQDGEAPWHVKHTHELGERESTSTLELSARSECFFCEQFWNSLSEQHHQLLVASEVSECALALYWDAGESRYTKFGSFFAPELKDDLLESNLDDCLTSLPPADLPSLFQSAFLIAEALGFRYIWIEKLCVSRTQLRINSNHPN
ncbi:hypothetical protein CC86DRAFT_146813 [Ophiobolus disseminans]|uniref:Heterokaryon incompatibility domain-containing protein n=1 Tax=Ophiobolus disseminans TaxID=1469910 RepID=A0A6A6ZEG4_9PLEO|nr:hypothetical protein CC86DRAFT_146813 [Ophiobolus disseminans]